MDILGIQHDGKNVDAIDNELNVTCTNIRVCYASPGGLTNSLMVFLSEV
jgi:hypothetical protein